MNFQNLSCATLTFPYVVFMTQTRCKPMADHLLRIAKSIGTCCYRCKLKIRPLCILTIRKKVRGGLMVVEPSVRLPQHSVTWENQPSTLNPPSLPASSSTSSFSHETTSVDVEGVPIRSIRHTLARYEF